MIIISNHVKKIGMEIPKDAIIRINVAWVEDLDELHDILSENKDNKIWLDYPTGRTKPPMPKLTLAETIAVAKSYGNLIKYFAFSNAEDTNIVELIRQAVPQNITLVPKIETIVGVGKIYQIVQAAKTDIIMLDCEDLYTDCNKKLGNQGFENYKYEALMTCKKYNIKCLTLKGVIFSEATDNDIQIES